MERETARSAKQASSSSLCFGGSLSSHSSTCCSFGFFLASQWKRRRRVERNGTGLPEPRKKNTPALLRSKAKETWQRRGRAHRCRAKPSFRGRLPRFLCALLRSIAAALEWRRRRGRGASPSCNAARKAAAGSRATITTPRKKESGPSPARSNRGWLACAHVAPRRTTPPPLRRAARLLQRGCARLFALLSFCPIARVSESADVLCVT